MADRTDIVSPTAPHCDPARIAVAIELSKKSWLVAVLTPLSEKIGLHNRPACDGQALLEFLAGQRRKVEAALGRPVEVVSCYEAGFDGFWLHRLLEAEGVRNHVFDPASLQVNRRARRAKTDRLDVQGLLRALLAHLRGEPQVVSVVRPPSPEQEDARRLHRERDRLLRERVQHTNRIKGLCATQGIYDYEPRRRDRHARLAELRTGDGRDLPPRLAAEIRRELQRLDLVLEMIGSVEAERNAIAEAKAMAAHPGAEKIQALTRLKAIGAETAVVLVGEAFCRCFQNRRQLGAYAGLDPSPFASGGMVRDQGIAKSGNPKLRTALIELAWLWLRYQSDSALSRWFRERVGSLKGRPRRIAIVAMARKLLVALWRYLETGLVPEGAVLKA